MPVYDRETLELLIDGKLPWNDTKRIMSAFKDPDRFDKYIEILSDRVKWDDRILLPLGLHLFIVEKTDGSRVVKCDCGHEFGDYHNNWKLSALIFVRDSDEKMQEIFPPLMHSSPTGSSCASTTARAAGPSWRWKRCRPVTRWSSTFQPDLETFYREWLNRTL